MTSATSAPVIVPMIATPNRLKNQPTTQPTGRRHVRRVALAEDRLDPPVDRVAERLERQRLLDERDQRPRRSGRG